MLPRIYCLLDCETTGTSSAKNRIIEICIHRYEDGNLVDKFQSLINPGCSLPDFIVGLTGIQPAMLLHAPSFKDVTERILEIVKGSTLIAHNARFDRSFIQKELQRVGVSYNFPILCTVSLSRKLFPAEKKHNLDSLAKRIGHVFSGRHRAEGDVMALEHFLRYAKLNFKENFDKAIIDSMKNQTIPHQIKKELIDGLPSYRGLYYFFDQSGKCIYVGRSQNIKERVRAHLSQDLSSKKSLLLKKDIADIEAKEVKSGLALEILEILEIQRLSPRFNRQYIKPYVGYTFSLKSNKDGYLVPQLESISKTSSCTKGSYGPFKSKKAGNSTLMTIAQVHNLCPNLLTKKAAKGACFQYHLKQCSGACCNKEAAKLYNLRLLAAVANYKLSDWRYDFPIVLDGEVSLLEWKVIGFKSFQYSFKNRDFNYDVYFVIKKYLEKARAKISKIDVEESGVA